LNSGDHVVETEQLVTMVRNVPMVLEDLGMPPNPKIPQDPRKAGDVLEAEDVILEFLQEAYASGHGA
jgi:hypothetical protein